MSFSGYMSIGENYVKHNFGEIRLGCFGSLLITFNISINVSCLQLECSITGLISHSVGSILINLIDLLDNLHRSCCSALRYVLRDN